MAVVEIRAGEFVDTDPVEAEPGCIRIEPDSAGFQNYLLPRIKGERDEASTEILASVRAGRPFGDAVLDAIESLPASKTQKLRRWVEEARATRIYAYVEFSSVFRMSYGLMLTVGGPRDRVLATEQIGGSIELENVAPYSEFHYALSEIRNNFNPRASSFYEGALYLSSEMKRESERAAKERDSRLASLFEENPLVEVDSKGEYDEALEAMGIPLEDGSWEKAGLYDFRDSPPTYSGALEAYERESMRDEAGRIFEMMFDNDEWRDACETLLEED